jgi:putative salt-induced outer membrane protein YdiY
MGEIKSFSKGVLVMETNYSDKDFNIEFNKIESIVIQRKCLILLTEGRRRFGNLRTDENGKVVITLEDGTKEYFKLEEIIALDEIDDNFWKRISGSIDLSFSLSKANSLTQFNIGGDLDYADESWMVEGGLNLLNSYQDNAERTKRTEAQLEFYRILPRKWYLIGDFSFLENTEQALEGRIKPSIGLGKFLVSTNKLYLGLSLGYAYNIENYIDSSFNKTSSESFIKASFSMFDFEDIDLESNINISPSLSEKGRIRTDYDLNLKYDLPLDLYIKLGFTLNYDNQPASGGNDIDYVFTTGFGWEFN